MAEIEDSELARLRGADRLLAELRGSPKHRRSVERAIKDHHPEFQTEDDRMAPYIEEAKSAAKSIIEESVKKQREQELENTFQSKLASYRLSERNPDGYTDEGIDKIVALMKERTIPDVDAAVALFEKMNPAKAEPPSGYVPTSWNFGNKADDDSKLLFEDPDAWAEKEARKVWEEEARKQRIG